MIILKQFGFRKFEGVFETKLYDTTSISGKNRSGKSNILYAIVNILLGTNLSGDEKSYPIVQPTEMDIKNIKAVDKYVRNVHI